MESVGVVSAFVAGTISFVSPCVLPLVPAYLSMVTGVSASEIKEGSVPRGPLVVGVSLFILGFTAVFVLLQLTISSFSQIFIANQVTMRRVAGITVALMGIALIAVMSGRFPRLSRDVRPKAAEGLLRNRAGIWAAPLLGAAFAFGWTPCIGPVLGSVLAVANTSETVVRGTFLLVAYSLGLGIPFLLVALGASKALGVLERLRPHSSKLVFIAGTGLVIFGGMLFFNKVSWIAIWLQKAFSAVGLDGLSRI
jgi:cytochrome c-type biogenesis protein